MRDTLKRTLAALASLTLFPLSSTAHEVRSPFPGNITATTYYPSGGYHGAIDVSSGRCNYWGAETAVVGSVFWDVTIGDLD